MWSWIVRYSLSSYLNYVFMTDANHKLSCLLLVCVTLSGQDKERKWSFWAHEWLRLWLMWCLVANCRVGRIEGFREESLILVLSWLRYDSLVFRLSTSVKWVGRRVLCASLVKEDDACIGKVIDWELELEFRVLCRRCNSVQKGKFNQRCVGWVPIILGFGRVAYR